MAIEKPAYQTNKATINISLRWFMMHAFDEGTSQGYRNWIGLERGPRRENGTLVRALVSPIRPARLLK